MSSNPDRPRRQTARPRAPARRSPPASRESPPEGERLQKVLAAAGVASRRASEDLILQGRVTIDDEVVRVLGTRVDPERARIAVDGERIAVHPRHEYVVVNKPAGVVTTARDPQGRQTVLDLVRARARLYPVGRLDVDTLGLVLLTNHGALAHRMTHPRYQVPRVYLAKVRGEVSPRALRRLTEGVPLEDGIARATSARVRGRGRSSTHIELTMTEGRKREVRRMLEEVGHPVIELVRTSFGPLRLGTLRAGESRRLEPAEIGRLLESVGL